MSKQDIILGNVVDDGTGDYLRRGGMKINSNFNELYTHLGDGVKPHAAGAWKTHKFVDGVLAAEYGSSWIIDSTAGEVAVNFPTDSDPQNIGKVIKIRDSYGVFNLNPVTINANIKGAGSVALNRKYQDAEFVKVSINEWQYAPQKLISDISYSEVPSVVKTSALAIANQRDFDIYSKISGTYNTLAVEVYRRGNQLYFGDSLSVNSDYGSIPPDQNPYYGGPGEEPVPTTWAPSTAYIAGQIVKRAAAVPTATYVYDYYVAKSSHTSGASFNALLWTQLNVGDLYALDGKTIRLTLPANVGDPIALTTYITDISTFRTSYNSKSIRVVDIGNETEDGVVGEVVKVDLQNTLSFTLTDFGFTATEQVNPDSTEIYVNGHALTKAGQAGTGDAGNGQPFDFDVVQDGTGAWNTIVFYEQLRDGDIVTIKWYDNVIGTLLTWNEGTSNIKDLGDETWLQNNFYDNLSIKNTLSYNDPQDPKAWNSEINASVSRTSISTVSEFFELMYPIGSLYFNANNPNNPADYMGFGTWVRYAQGKALVGWQDPAGGQPDDDFGKNPQWDALDPDNSVPSAGGTGGFKSTTLTPANIPELSSGVDDVNDRDYEDPTEKYALVSRPQSGDINLNGCQPDPDSTDTALGFYKEEPIKVNAGVIPSPINILQPYITINVWVRTA